MKYILTEEEVTVPTNVEVSFKNRELTVKGPRGTLKKNFKHMSFDIVKGLNRKKKEVLKLQMWFAGRKQKTSCITVASHIRNMITGVTRGYRYKMRFAYAHFPINSNISKDNKTIEIKNFIGEKFTRKIDMLGDVKVSKKEDVKDEITIEGNDLNNVSLSCALIHQSTLVKNKDIRKFLDGIYISEKQFIEGDD
mmetsp:Transcript_27849/g.24478  ORF Transcript_27849/g.24478 Transcript_27849/m.24478 type:complete len:194 (+) Transcript_27849:47-628(+)